MMDPQLNNETKQRVSQAEKPESAWRHVFSFFWMILFTAIAFVVVGSERLNPEATFWVITLLAVLQVILQLFTFMHLNQKGYGIVIIYMAVGIFIAVVSAIGIVLLL